MEFNSQSIKTEARLASVRSMLTDIKEFFGWTGDNHGQTVILALSFVLLCDLILVFSRCILSISPAARLGLVKTIV